MEAEPQKSFNAPIVSVGSQIEARAESSMPTLSLHDRLPVRLALQESLNMREAQREAVVQAAYAQRRASVDFGAGRLLLATPAFKSPRRWRCRRERRSLTRLSQTRKWQGQCSLTLFSRGSVASSAFLSQLPLPAAVMPGQLQPPPFSSLVSILAKFLISLPSNPLPLNDDFSKVVKEFSNLAWKRPQMSSIA